MRGIILFFISSLIFAQYNWRWGQKEIRVYYGGDPVYNDDIEDAIRAWNNQLSSTGYYMRLVNSSANAHVLIIWDTSSAYGETQPLSYTGDECNGVPYVERVRVTLNSNVNFSFNCSSQEGPPYFYNVILHEIGHVWGLPHLSGCNEIMSQYCFWSCLKSSLGENSQGPNLLRALYSNECYPYVEFTSPYDGQTGLSDYPPIKISFSKRMDEVSVRAGVSINAGVEYEYSGSAGGGREFTFEPQRNDGSKGA